MLSSGYESPTYAPAGMPASRGSVSRKVLKNKRELGFKTDYMQPLGPSQTLEYPLIFGEEIKGLLLKFGINYLMTII